MQESLRQPTFIETDACLGVVLLLEGSVWESSCLPAPRTWEAADGMFSIYRGEIELESD